MTIFTDAIGPAGTASALAAARAAALIESATLKTSAGTSARHPRLDAPGGCLRLLTRSGILGGAGRDRYRAGTIGICFPTPSPDNARHLDVRNFSSQHGSGHGARLCGDRMRRSGSRAGSE